MFSVFILCFFYFPKENHTEDKFDIHLPNYKYDLDIISVSWGFVSRARVCDDDVILKIHVEILRELKLCKTL